TSLRWADASDALAVSASTFARSTSIRSAFGTSLSGTGPAVAGCGTGVEPDDAGLVVSACEEADLSARTSRAISKQVSSSVLLDSPPVVARVTQCRLSAAEKLDHSRFNCSRTARSLSMHC